MSEERISDAELARGVLLACTLDTLCKARVGQSWSSGFLSDLEYCIEGIRADLDAIYRRAEPSPSPASATPSVTRPMIEFMAEQREKRELAIRAAVVEECARACDELIEVAQAKMAKRGYYIEYDTAWIDALNHAAALIRLRALSPPTRETGE